MNSLCQRILNHYGATVGMENVARRPWYLFTGGAGPNAVLKILVPAYAGQRGYVLTVARHSDTRVLSHEVAILRRLRENLPDLLRQSIPAVLAYSRCAGLDYFALPFFQSAGYGRIRTRLARARRRSWVQEWLTDVGRATADGGLSGAWLQAEYAGTIERILSDPRVPAATKHVVQKHFDLVQARAAQIPAVCCHGDLWAENILWKRGSKAAVVVDWGAARWPGLPCVDLCRFGLANGWSDPNLAEVLRGHCQAIELDPSLVPALYDLYNVFVKGELDVAYASQPHAKFDPFLNGLPSDRISRVLAVHP